jgi:hypothetical protein
MNIGIVFIRRGASKSVLQTACTAFRCANNHFQKKYYLWISSAIWSSLFNEMPDNVRLGLSLVVLLHVIWIITRLCFHPISAGILSPSPTFDPNTWPLEQTACRLSSTIILFILPVLSVAIKIHWEILFQHSARFRRSKTAELLSYTPDSIWLFLKLWRSSVRKGT